MPTRTLGPEGVNCEIPISVGEENETPFIKGVKTSP